LTLGYDFLIFQEGTPAFQGIEFNWQNKKQENSSEFSNNKQKYTVPKNQIDKISLERIGERQRLSFDYGRERVEIGYYLTEPEREWLYQTLNDWKAA
jgi:hypothetical protein